MYPKNKRMSIRFVDLFCGIGGTRLGFEQACKRSNLKPVCVLSSDIKKHAISVYEDNFEDTVQGDIRSIKAEDVPDFDVLLAGFSCQPFSTAGRQRGFLDTRGTLFFEIERILRDKKPFGFILENVPGLVTHAPRPGKRIGSTFRTMLHSLRKLGYSTRWKLINSADFGVA